MYGTIPYIHMREGNELDETFQTGSRSWPPNTLGYMGAYIYSYIYICAVLSLCYVQTLVFVMCSL